MANANENVLQGGDSVRVIVQRAQSPSPAEMMVVLAADEPLVMHTPMLPWVPMVDANDGSAQVAMPWPAMAKAFLPRCELRRDPADMVAANTRSVLTMGLEAVAGSTILTGLRDAGLVDTLEEEGATHRFQFERIMTNSPWQLWQPFRSMPPRGWMLTHSINNKYLVQLA